MTAKTNRNYILSQTADQDISEIFDYTEKEHSFNPAIRYLIK